MGARSKAIKVEEAKKNKNYLNGIPMNPALRAKFFSNALDRIMAKKYSSDELGAKRMKNRILQTMSTLNPSLLSKITSVDKYLKAIATQQQNLSQVTLLDEAGFIQMCLKFKKEPRFKKNTPLADHEDLFFLTLNKMINAFRKEPSNPRYSSPKNMRELFKHAFNNTLKDEIKRANTQTRTPVEIDFADIDWELRENSLTPLERISEARLNYKILSLMRTCGEKDSTLLNIVLMTFTGESEEKINHAIKGLKLVPASYISEIKKLFSRFPDLKEELEEASLNKEFRCDNISISVLGLHSYSQSAISNVESERSGGIVKLNPEPCYSFKHKDGQYFGTVEVIVAEKNVVVNCGPVKSIDQARYHLRSEVQALIKRSNLKVA